jgi:hypothetical protein
MVKQQCQMTVNSRPAPNSNGECQGLPYLNNRFADFDKAQTLVTWFSSHRSMLNENSQAGPRSSTHFGNASHNTVHHTLIILGEISIPVVEQRTLKKGIQVTIIFNIA